MIKTLIKILRQKSNSTTNQNANISTTANVQNSTIGNLVKVGEYSHIINSTISGNVSIKDHSLLENCIIAGGNVSVGRYSSFNGPGSDIITKIHDVSIGNFCSIARYCTIQEFNHISNRCTTYNIFRNLIDAKDRQNCIWNGPDDKDTESRGSIVIGNDVWIGAQCVILSGVSIGDGAIIAANSTVVKDVPPYAVVGGTPAKVLKYRFEQLIVDELLRIKWWEWEDDKIRRNKAFFDGPMDMEKLQHIVP